jgi:hypothetical protein
MKSEELGKILLANPGLDVFFYGPTTITGICSKGNAPVTVVVRKTSTGGDGTKQLILGVAGDENEIQGDILLTDYGFQSDPKLKPR